jgi:peroxiredoxin
MVETHVTNVLREALLRARDLDAPINQRLQCYADALRRHHTVFAEAVDQLVARLEVVGAGALAPKIGEAMPPFLLPDDSGQLVGLFDVLRGGPVAIAFHRGHWCPYCHINARALGRLHAKVVASGGQIIAITPERQRYTRLHKAMTEAGFKILSDMANGYALSLNLAIWVGDEVKAVMADFGRDLGSYQGTESWFLPIPATFVVNTHGIITARYVDPDYRRRMDIDALSAALQAAE